MNNNFTDFFETLLPREIVLYIIPGSFILSVVLYISKLKPNVMFNNYINLRDASSAVSLIDYVFFGMVWVLITYFIGLIMGGTKQGIHRKIKKWEEINPLISPQLKHKNKQEPTSESHELTKEQGMYAMYLAIREEKMYRREIERYGVLVEAIENIAVALVIGAIILCFTRYILWGIALLLIAIFPVLAGAQGYKKLQYYRIETMFEALEEKERRGIK